jgi:hypothetical protein
MKAKAALAALRERRLYSVSTVEVSYGRVLAKVMGIQQYVAFQ